jgi:hypothetical protein
MKGLLMLVIGVALTGCAPHYYVKAGGTQQEFYQAKTSCTVKLNQSGLNDGRYLASIIQQNRFFDECMAGEGWGRQ